ncbi:MULTISPECIES: hypothetical protein [Cupriavidus]|nr:MULTISPECIES: hypothetical protein [Cupriavidus]MDT6962876.1 hypothetical protein [Cupriavidus sp. SZY C1]
MIDMQDPIFIRLRDSKRVQRWTLVGIAVIAALAMAFPFLTGAYR